VQLPFAHDGRRGDLLVQGEFPNNPAGAESSIASFQSAPPSYELPIGAQRNVHGILSLGADRYEATSGTLQVDETWGSSPSAGRLIDLTLRHVDSVGDSSAAGCTIHIGSYPFTTADAEPLPGSAN
jgi:hypothetical protein